MIARIPSGTSEVMSFEIPQFSFIELPFLCAQNFKAEHLPVVWSQVLYVHQRSGRPALAFHDQGTIRIFQGRDKRPDFGSVQGSS